MSAVDVEGQPILIANVDGAVHAHVNRCGRYAAALHFGTVRCRAAMLLAWCRYDVRTGKRLDGGTHPLSVVPVVVEGDEIQVAVGVEPRSGALTVRTLIAGFGNVLRGDDGFGVEVIRRLQEGGAAAGRRKSWKWAPRIPARPEL